jgi:hypothetical protein
MSVRRAIALLAVAAVAACSDSGGPSTHTILPPEDISLDPAALRLGEIVYSCRGWAASPPSEDTLVVDIVFGRRGPDDPMDRPRASSLRAIQRAGGEALFAFAFPVVRTRIARDRLPALMASSFASHALSAPDLRRYDLSVSVGFNRALAGSDSLLFLQLGGRLHYWWPFINAVAGDLPNRSALTLRRRDDVRWVEHSGIACLVSPPPTTPD